MTNTLRVGTLVLSNDYRHPVILAKEIATLDVLSGGRVELGLGAGFSQAEYNQAGLPFDPPPVRVDRFEEGIHVLKGLFTDGPLTFAGKHYSVTHLDSFPSRCSAPIRLSLSAPLAGACCRSRPGKRHLGIQTTSRRTGCCRTIRAFA